MNKIILVTILTVILLTVSFTSVSALSPENEKKLNDKIKSLEKKIKDLFAENTKFKIENTKLKTENTKLKPENTKLKTIPQTTPQINTQNMTSKFKENVYAIDPMMAMSLTYPSGWYKETQFEDSIITNHVLSISEKPISKKSEIRFDSTQINFYRHTGVHLPASPSEVKTLQESQIFGSEQTCKSLEFCKDYEIIESKIISISGLPAYKIKYSQLQAMGNGDSWFTVTGWKINLPFKNIRGVVYDFDIQYNISQKSDVFDLTAQKKLNDEIIQFEKNMDAIINTIKIYPTKFS